MSDALLNGALNLVSRCVSNFGMLLPEFVGFHLKNEEGHPLSEVPFFMFFPIF